MQTTVNPDDRLACFSMTLGGLVVYARIGQFAADLFPAVELFDIFCAGDIKQQQGSAQNRGADFLQFYPWAGSIQLTVKIQQLLVACQLIVGARLKSEHALWRGYLTVKSRGPQEYNESN